MSQPTPEEILSAVRDAGWLLEQDTARSLETHEFHTQLGWAYEDPDDPTTSREVDVMGYRQFFRDEDARLIVSAHVLAECKQSGNPYVLIGREPEERLRQQQPKQHILRFNNLVTKSERREKGVQHSYGPAWAELGLNTLPGSPSLETFRASQLVRLDRGKTWTANNSGIFNALVFPLAKALQAAQKRYKSSDYPLSSQQVRSDEWGYVALHFPMVVTSAPLYRVDATHPESSITEVPWGKVIRQLETKSIKGLFEIDVVNYHHLPLYMSDQVVQFAANIASLAKEDPQQFRASTSPRFATSDSESSA
jgi:hypothetical protein